MKKAFNNVWQLLILPCCILLSLLCSCHSSSSEKKFDVQENCVDVRDYITPISTGDKDLSIFAIPYILNDYLILTDYKSPDQLIHLFDKHTFSYRTSIGEHGEGPGEISNLGGLAMNEKEHRFYVIDYGKQKILEYPLDSVLANPLYVPQEKVALRQTEFPSTFQYINDTLAFSQFIRKMENGDYKPVAARWNMHTGDVAFMDYSGHPQVERKRVCFAASVKHQLYAEAYWHHDLMSVCTLDGKLKWNVYGRKWNNKTSNEDLYFRNIAFCGDKIVASYTGGRRLSQTPQGMQVNYPTALLVFNLEGDYVCKLETGYPILTFCVDEELNRIVLAFDDEMQLGYLDLNAIL